MHTSFQNFCTVLLVIQFQFMCFFHTLKVSSPMKTDTECRSKHSAKEPRIPEKLINDKCFLHPGMKVTRIDERKVIALRDTQ